MVTQDIHGRLWNLASHELCPDCGQPDNCGDCTHEPLGAIDVRVLGGIDTEVNA